MNRITIQEIASALSLSRNTVSKALADSNTVTKETKELIIKKAVEMGYPTYKIKIPEYMSEIVVPEDKKNILILSRRETANFWNKMILGISDVINEHQDTMQLHVVSAEDEAENYIPSEWFENIDGIILMSVFKQSFVDKLMNYKLPVVFFDAPNHSDHFLQYGDVILPEGFNSTRNMVNSLIKQGLKRLTFLGDITYCRSITDRYLGFCSAMAENGLTPDNDMQFTKHVNNRYYTREEVETAINSCKYTPDAIICANDDIAVFAYGILREHGLAIPKDIAVTGFDNTDMAEIISPGLTTAIVHTQTMGRRLASQLYNRIKKPDAPKELIFVCTEVVARDSSRRRKLF